VVCAIHEQIFMNENVLPQFCEVSHQRKKHEQNCILDPVTYNSSLQRADPESASAW
jgi:hypothetical protein